MKPVLLYVTMVSFTIASGCMFGPKTLTNTHHEYTEAVKQISEEHLLYTLLRIRYNETPTNLDLSSIAAQYEITANAEARPFFSTESASGIFRGFSRVLPFAGVGASNRPTFSYTPGDDGTTVRRNLTPIATDTLVFLSQTNWPVSNIMRLYVARMNGVPNGLSNSTSSNTQTPDFARFVRATELIQQLTERQIISIAGGERTVEMGDALPADRVTASNLTEAAKSGLEYRKREDGMWTLIRRDAKILISVNSGGEKDLEFLELCQLINLDPKQLTYEISVSVRSEPDPAKYKVTPLRELRVATRSNAQVLHYLSQGIDVPAEHLNTGVATPSSEGLDYTKGIIQIKHASGHCAPKEAYVAVHFRDHWFYIDDSDTDSKRTFALMMQLNRLDFSRTNFVGPTLTLPVGR